METQKARQVAIEAKYLRPRLDRVSLRDEAMCVFADALGRRLTVVCAPAGYGKTTTTAAALDACHRRAVWYKLDVLDRDPLSFLAAMTRAVQRLQPGFGDDLLRELESGPMLDVPPQVLAARFCSECDQVVTEDGHIVLDDYHETMDAPAMDAVLGYLLDNCPGTMRFVVLTRYEPTFPLAKLRLSGEVAGISRDLLLFDEGQVAEVLEQRSGKRHDPEHVRHLLELTEGWPASVVLAGMTLAWLDVASLEVALADPRLRGDVFSYLAEQVFRRQSKDVQRLLLRTCCLDYVHGELAERLLKESTAARHLHFLAHNHVLTFDSGRQGAYRYHNLLRDFLRQRFVQDEGATAFRALQRETATALEECGDRPAAVELLLSANELDLALDAVARGGENLLEHLPTEQLRTWAQRLTDISKAEHPWSLIVSGVLDTRIGRFDQALGNLERAVAQLSEPESKNLYQALSILEWSQFWSGDSLASMDTCYRALEHAGSNAERLHTLLSLLSSSVDMRRWDAVKTASEEAERLLPHAQASEVLRAQALQAHAAFYQGNMHAARALILGCHQHSASLAQQATMLNTRGMIETALGQYASATSSLAAAAATAKDFGHSLTSHIEDNHAFLQASMGQFDAALDVLRGLEYRQEPADPTHLCIVFTHQGTALRRSGQADAALQPTGRAAETVSVERDAYLAYNAQSNLAFCEGLLGSERQSKLLTLSSRAERTGVPFVELKAQLFAGVLAYVGDSRAGAVELLERCLPLQLELGHVNLVAQELCPRPELASLVLRRHKSNGLGPALIEALSHHWMFTEFSKTLRELCQSQVGTWIDLVTRENRGAAPSPRKPAPAASGVSHSSLDDLTPREMEVLRLLAAKRSNDEIGKELFISLATVKSHVRHILRKLGQTRRLGAVLEFQRLSGLGTDPAGPHDSLRTQPSDTTGNQPWV